MNPDTFAGFTRPHENFYRLPNDWFDLLARARAAIGKVSIVGLIRLLEYLIKHTWGMGNFDAPIRLSLDELQKGRVVGRANGQRVRLDRGTGLDRGSLVAAIQQAEALGLLERSALGGDAARQRFAYALRIAAGEDAATGAPLSDGFPDPRANYFIVPKDWTDFTAGQRSDALILAVEYLIRHAWGWRSRRDEVHWLSADEVANGRQYRRAAADSEVAVRYDGGTGYSLDKTYTALDKGVESGLLVWREGQTRGGAPVRLYTLRRAGWPTGPWQPLGDDTSGGDEIHLSLHIPDSANLSPSPAHQTPPPNHLSPPDTNASPPASRLSPLRSVKPTSDRHDTANPLSEPPPAPTGDAGGGGGASRPETIQQATLCFYPQGREGPRVEATGPVWQGSPLPADRVLLMGEAPETVVITIDLTTAAQLLVRGVEASLLGWSVAWWDGGLSAAEQAEAAQRQNVVEDLRAVLAANWRDWGHWDLHTALAEGEAMGADAAAELVQTYGAREVGNHLAALRALRTRSPGSVRNLPGLLRWKLARGEQPPHRRALDDL